MRPARGLPLLSRPTAAPTLSHQRRSRRVPAPVAAHAGKAARAGRRSQVPQVRPPRDVRRGRPRCLGRRAQLREHVRARVRRAAFGGQPCALIAGARVAFAMSSPALPMRQRPMQARTARSVPRLAGRHGAARQPGLDGLSVLLAGEVAAHGADRLPRQRHHDPRGGHAGAWHRHDLGCGHPDLGCKPDCGSPRCGLAPVAADAGHALRDPALHRARYVAARLPAPQGGLGSAAVHDRGHVDPRDDRAAPASLLMDQRVEGTGRCQGHPWGWN